MVQFRKNWRLVFVVIVLTGCSEVTESLNGYGGNSNAPATGAAYPGGTYTGQTGQVLTRQLSDDAFNELSEEQQYATANKLLSTLYKGVPVHEYFKLENGLTSLQSINGGGYFTSLVRRLQTPMQNEQMVHLDRYILGGDEVDNGSGMNQEAAFRFSRDRARELPLARIHVYPVSRQLYTHWMAWHLANSLLFSPAAELDSAGMTDVQNVYRRLVNGIERQDSMRLIVGEHMRSLENWRRFRSPEDNTREMMEIFLGLEDQDDEVPRASKACQDLYLTSENEGYLLAYTDFPNDEPQTVLDTTIVNCDDFYDAVANHQRLIPTVAWTLVRYFYAGKTFPEQNAVVEALVAGNPQTFEDVFSAIIFSEEYLLNSERMRSFEEAFLPIAERIEWKTREDTFTSLASGRGGMSRAHMEEMGWPAMTSKLGRAAGIATDALSFANYHKALREELLIDRWRYGRPLGLIEPETDDIEEEGLTQAEYAARESRHRQLQLMSLKDLVDYFFMSAVSRRATEEEREALLALFHKNDWLRFELERTYVKDGRLSDVAWVTFDYLSRLPEMYYLTRVQETNL